MIFAIPPHGRLVRAAIGFGHVQATTLLINDPISQPSICFHPSLPKYEP
jgi:hypothetical protein